MGQLFSGDLHHNADDSILRQVAKCMSHVETVTGLVNIVNQA